MTQFNAKEHLIQLKSKQGTQDYLPVQWRLVWFREACPDGTIETEVLHLDLDKEMEEEVYVWNQEKKRNDKVRKVAKGVAIFRATVKDGKGGIAMGTKMEKAVSFPDFLEKSETGAIGRALAALGYGTQFAPELAEHERIVDSPVSHESGQNDERISSQVPAQKNGVAPSGRESGPSERGSRLNALYQKAQEAGAIEKGLGKHEGAAAFLTWAGEVLSANVANVGQLTASRIEALETFLSTKEAA